MFTIHKLLVTIFILLSLNHYSQIGGRLKEMQNQKRLAKHIRKSGWIERKWMPNKLKVIEPEYKLFGRYRTINEEVKEKIQKSINDRRYRKRIRGNNVFHKKKYFR